MKQLLIFTLFMSITGLSWTQGSNNKQDALHVTSSFGNLSFYHNGIPVNKRDYRDVISTNPEAREMFRKANNTALIADVFNFVGWFGIGWTLGSFLASSSPDEVNWRMGAIGVGSLLISLPIASSAEQSHRAAAKKFNEGLNNNLSLLERGELHLQISPNRVGLQFNF
jgi:hypothetical protein